MPWRCWVGVHAWVHRTAGRRWYLECLNCQATSPGLLTGPSSHDRERAEAASLSPRKDSCHAHPPHAPRHAVPRLS